MENNSQTKAVATRPVDQLKKVVNAETVQQQFKNALGDHKDAFVASLIERITWHPSKYWFFWMSHARISLNMASSLKTTLCVPFTLSSITAT